MVTRLRQLGMLRRAADPDVDLLDELFHTGTAKMQCASCREVGLALEEVADEGWEDERCCEACGKVIPRERLDVLPGAVRCAACAH